MREITWDPKLPGFGLRTRNGKRTWVFQYKIGDRNRRIKIGGPELSREQARKLAQALQGDLAKARLGHGTDPATERDKIKQAKTRPANSFAATIPAYLEARAGGLKPATHEAQARHLNNHWAALHGLALADIARADVAASLSAIAKDHGPIAANRARATLSKFYAWAIGEGLCDTNPVIGTNKRDENDPRERSLSDAEVAKVWLAAPDNDYGHIVKLGLLTGCRRTELGDLKWSEVDLDAKTITLPKERTKNGQQHVVPLSATAMAILSNTERGQGDYVFGRTDYAGFSGWSKSKAELDEAVKLKPWTLHDLRRTTRTGLGKIGVQPHIAEAVINHLPPKLVRTYDTHTYEAEKRNALDRWATHLKTVVAQATGSNVTALRQGDSTGGRKRRH